MGTEDDDHNPPRIAPRHLFDLSVGTDNLFHTDRTRVTLRLTAINLTNREALYNFPFDFQRDALRHTRARSERKSELHSETGGRLV